MTTALTGVTAGMLLGYVLQRSGLCFHAAVARGYRGDGALGRGWLLGVALASVGLSLLFLTPLGDGLSRGLPFLPVAAVLGGLLIGAGMAVARSCVSGLFYKLGAGMLGALVGLVGWGAGEVLARQFPRPGPTLLAGGDGATLPGLLGVPRLPVAIVFALLAAVVVLRHRDDGPRPDWQWGPRRTGVALALATTAGWLLAGVGGASFGPSTVGAVSGAVSGAPNWWLITFLVGIVLGSVVAASTTGQLRLRGEEPLRYRQLALGGLLLGAGGWVAGGCNLGHGLSGIAQLNVSSVVVVLAAVAGVGLTRALQRRTGRLVELSPR